MPYNNHIAPKSKNNGHSFHQQRLPKAIYGRWESFVGKQNRDGQSPESALFVTGGTAGDETSLIGGIVESMGKSATLARLVTVASSVVTSPLFLASAGVLATVALAKKLRDDDSVIRLLKESMP